MNNIARPAIFFLIAIFPLLACAKEKGTGPAIIIDEKNFLWNHLPWVWVTGGGIFILFLVAMLRTGREKV